LASRGGKKGGERKEPSHYLPSIMPPHTPNGGGNRLLKEKGRGKSLSHSANGGWGSEGKKGGGGEKREKTYPNILCGSSKLLHKAEGGERKGEKVGGDLSKNSFSIILSCSTIREAAPGGGGRKKRRRNRRRLAFSSFLTLSGEPNLPAEKVTRGGGERGGEKIFFWFVPPLFAWLK